MSEREISEEAIEAAARAIERLWCDGDADFRDSLLRDDIMSCRREEARAALEAALPLIVAGERELLEDVAFQFAYRSNNKRRRWLTTGGLSTLEDVFDALGWDDPHYVTEGGCEHPGCNAWDTSGTPTDDGYKRLCFEHYQAVNAIRADKGGE